MRTLMPSRMKFTSEIYKAWTTFLGSTTTDGLWCLTLTAYRKGGSILTVELCTPHLLFSPGQFSSFLLQLILPSLQLRLTFWHRLWVNAPSICVYLTKFSLKKIWAACLYMLSVSLTRCKNEALKKLHLKCTIKCFKNMQVTRNTILIYPHKLLLE